MALRCRKNQSTLSATERSRFVAAVLAIKASGVYDQFVQWHVHNMPGAHRGPAFFAWHREYLRRFELELQNVDPSVTLPYWDWTVDNSATSSIWNADLIGGDGQPSDGIVTTGPFAFNTGNWTLNTPDGPELRRRFGRDPIAPTLPTPTDLSNALAEGVYDVSPWSVSSGSGLRNRAEGWISGPQMHNRVHVWVGGSMTPSSSPNDPVFFLHHCFVDKQWADWQALHPGIDAYLPLSGAAAGHNRNDPMEPWASLGATVTPGSVIDHHVLGYAYDTEAVCRPTLKFHDDGPFTIKLLDDRPTLKVIDDKPTLKVVDDQPTIKLLDDQPTLKLVDDQPTLKVVDDRPTLKAVDDQPTIKFTEDPITIKFLDDGGTVKVIDDVKLPALDKHPALESLGMLKGPADVVSPAGSSDLWGAAPFVLATPHHSMAWTQTFPQAAEAAFAGLQEQLQRVDAAIAGRESSETTGAKDQVSSELAVLRRERNALMQELQQFAGVG